MSAINENEKINKMVNTIKEMENTIKEKKGGNIEEQLESDGQQFDSDGQQFDSDGEQSDSDGKHISLDKRVRWDSIYDMKDSTSTNKSSNPNVKMYGLASSRSTGQFSGEKKESTSGAGTDKSSKPVVKMYGLASRSTNQFSEDNKESTSGVGSDKSSKPVVKKYERTSVQKYTIPISGMLVTEDEYKEFERNFKYLLETNNKNRGTCFPRPDWLREYGFDTSKETLIKLGFKVASCQPESVSKEFGWDFKEYPPNTRRAHFEVLPFAGHEHKKDGTMRYVDYRPKPGSNNQTNSTVGSMGMGPSIYQDGGAVFGFGFGGSYVSSGPMMPSC